MDSSSVGCANDKSILCTSNFENGFNQPTPIGIRETGDTPWTGPKHRHQYCPNIMPTHTGLRAASPIQHPGITPPGGARSPRRRVSSPCARGHASRSSKAPGLPRSRKEGAMRLSNCDLVQGQNRFAVRKWKPRLSQIQSGATKPE